MGNPLPIWSDEHGWEAPYERATRERQRAEHLARQAAYEGRATARPDGWLVAANDQLDGDTTSTRALQERSRGADSVTGKAHEEWARRAMANVPEEPVRKPEPPREDPYADAIYAYQRKQQEAQRAAEERAVSGWLGQVERRFRGDSADAEGRLDRLRRGGGGDAA